MMSIKTEDGTGDFLQGLGGQDSLSFSITAGR